MLHASSVFNLLSEWLNIYHYVYIRNVILLNPKRTRRKRTDLAAPIACPFHRCRSGREENLYLIKIRALLRLCAFKMIGAICQCTYLINMNIKLLLLFYANATVWWEEHQKHRHQRWVFSSPKDLSYAMPRIASYDLFKTMSCDLHGCKRELSSPFSNLTGLVNFTGYRVQEREVTTSFGQIIQSL